jgi:hypothetical protein
MHFTHGVEVTRLEPTLVCAVSVVLHICPEHGCARADNAMAKMRTIARAAEVASVANIVCYIEHHRHVPESGAKQGWVNLTKCDWFEVA